MRWQCYICFKYKYLFRPSASAPIILCLPALFKVCLASMFDLYAFMSVYKYTAFQIKTRNLYWQIHIKNCIYRALYGRSSFFDFATAFSFFNFALSVCTGPAKAPLSSLLDLKVMANFPYRACARPIIARVSVIRVKLKADTAYFVCVQAAWTIIFWNYIYFCVELVCTCRRLELPFKDIHIYCG